MTIYSHILLATDFSSGSDRVAEKAARLAKATEARLSIIHVVEFMGLTYTPEFPAQEDLEMEKNLVAAAKQRLQTLAEKQDIADSHVTVGSPKHEICDMAEQSGIDLIIVGSHGRHGLQLLLGSTANGVLHMAACDVLAVHMEE